MADVAEIARKLDATVREAIIEMRWSDTEEPVSYDAYANGEYCCERHATMLGLELRTHLLEGTSDAR